MVRNEEEKEDIISLIVEWSNNKLHNGYSDQNYVTLDIKVYPPIG